MSNQAGWYPQSDGRQRYWDGELWTEHFAPGVPVVEPPTIILGGRTFSSSFLLGWGGLALVVLVGALTSGFSGAVVMLGLYVLVVALIGLARGWVHWAQLGNRAASGVALGAAFVLIIIGSLAAPTSAPPTTNLITTVSDSQTTTDDAAAVAAATAAEEAAAEEASQAAEEAAASQAADETAAVVASQAAKAAETAAAKAAKEAAAAKTKAAARAAAIAAASKAADDAAAAAAAKAADAVAAAPPPPPDASVYYANCTAVRAAGAAPIYPGDPGFQSKFDRDKDGIGCE